MKQYLFVIMVIVGVLLMGGAAWAIRNGGLSVDGGLQDEGVAQVSVNLESWVSPVEQFDMTLPFGAAFDEVCGQWSARDYALLTCRAGETVLAMKSGQVVGSELTKEGWEVSVRHDEENTTVYGGLSESVREGRQVGGGEALGRLRGDTLKLAWKNNGAWADPMRLLP